MVFSLLWSGMAVSNESFWNPVRKYISFLKFRYTDGWVGSDTATGRRFMYQGVFTGLTGTMFGTNYTSANGYGEEKYGVNVTWSKSRKQDLGIDIKFLNDNLSFVVDFSRNVATTSSCNAVQSPATQDGSKTLMLIWVS